MEFVPIFANPSERPLRGLYAVRYEDAPDNEHSWSQFIDKLSDPEYRRVFMRERKTKLLTNGYWGTYSISDATERALDEFLSITDELRDAYELSVEELIKTLNERFKPLDNQKIEEYLERSKAKPKEPKEPWIRLYAVKVAEDLFIFTGGTIKLVKYMDDDEATKQERARLNKLRDFLKDEGMYDHEAYTELEL